MSHLSLHVCKFPCVFCWLAKQIGSYLQHGCCLSVNGIPLHLHHLQTHVFLDVTLQLWAWQRKHQLGQTTILVQICICFSLRIHYNWITKNTFQHVAEKINHAHWHTCIFVFFFNKTLHSFDHPKICFFSFECLCPILIYSQQQRNLLKNDFKDLKISEGTESY